MEVDTIVINARRKVDALAVMAAGATSRRLLLGEAEMKAHRRRLGFFSALMTSGSFMCMQAGAF